MADMQRSQTRHVRERVQKMHSVSRHSQVESNKEELFDSLADTNGNIPKTAFSKLFDIVRDDVMKEENEKGKLKGELEVSHRRARFLRLTICFASCCMIILLGGNAGLAYATNRMSKVIAIGAGGELTPNGGGSALKTAQAAYPFPLSSSLTDEALGELRFFEATSETGASIRLEVNGFMRMPAQQCRLPIVKLITPAGTVVVEGDQLHFDAAVAPVFLEAGFLTHALASGAGSADGRRKLSFAMLKGFFNSAGAAMTASGAGSDGASACTPDLPTLPMKYVGKSARLERCGALCEDDYGFTMLNLVGTQQINGEPYLVSDVSEWVETFVWDLDGKEYTRSKTVTRYPRFPELYHVELDNGTHLMQWVEYDSSKYRCAKGAGFADKGWGNVTDRLGAAAVSVEAAGDETITYEGLAWYSSSHTGQTAKRYADVPSYKYKVAFNEDDGTAPSLVQELYTNVNNTNLPYAVQTYELDELTMQYELLASADLYDVKIDAMVTAADLPLSVFAFPDDSECVVDETLEIPPNPATDPVGDGLVLSNNKWGEPEVIDGSCPAAAANVSACAEPNDPNEDTTPGTSAGRLRELSHTIEVDPTTVEIAGFEFGTKTQTYHGTTATCLYASASGGFPTAAGPAEITGTASGCIGGSNKFASGCIGVSLGCNSATKKFLKKKLRKKLCKKLGMWGKDVIDGDVCLTIDEKPKVRCSSSSYKTSRYALSISGELSMSMKAGRWFKLSGGLLTILRQVKAYSSQGGGSSFWMKAEIEARIKVGWMTLKKNWNVMPTSKKRSCSKRWQHKVISESNRPELLNYVSGTRPSL